MPASNRAKARAAQRDTAGADPNSRPSVEPASNQSSLRHSHIWALALLHSVMFALMFPPFDVWPLSFLAAAPLAWIAIHARTTRAAMLPAWVVMSAMWLWLNRWLIEVTLPGYPFLGVYMSFYPVLFIWIVRRVHRHPRLGRLPMTLVVPVVWTAMEYLRGDLVCDGYPWYHLAHTMIGWLAFVQSAGLLGTYFVSCLVAMVSGLIVDVLLAREANRSAGAQPKRLRATFAAAVIVLGLNLVWGWVSMLAEPSESKTLRILAIQTNLPQSNKMEWSEEMQARDVTGFIALTRNAFAACDPKPQLIVWPETTVPGLGFDPKTLENLKTLGSPSALRQVIWPEAILALSSELNVPMLVGSDAWVGTSIQPSGEGRIRLEREHNYNSAFLIQPGKPLQRYDKFFLTPMGETMPYISNWDWLEEKLLAFGAQGMTFELDSNPDIQLLELQASHDQTVTLATPICFEDTVAHFCRRMVNTGGPRRADLVVNLSNDGWFTPQSDRKLHAQIARFRCIELGMSMVRCVNTGYSIWVDDRGRLHGAVGGTGYGKANQEGALVADVHQARRESWYSRVGEVWPQACLAATLLALGLTRVGKRAKAGA